MPCEDTETQVVGRVSGRRQQSCLMKTESEITAKGHRPEAEEERKDAPPESLQGAWPYQYLVFRILASRTVRQYISVVFKSTSLWYFVMVALGN